MGKINLAILDGDTRYVDNLAYYVSENYRHRFRLATFSGRESFIGHVSQKNVKTDILLVDAEKCGDWLNKLESVLIILLSDGAPADAPGFERVDRYCGADKLIADILKIYSKSENKANDADGASGGRENKIVAVLSAEGGVGKTSFAIAFCTHFAKIGLTALYLGTGYMDAEEFAFDGGRDGGLSEIIYTMKARPEKLGIKLEALRKQAPGYGFYYYNPPIYPMDIDELQTADIDTLIAKLRGAGIYDRIVFDAQCGLSLRNKALIEHADHLAIVARATASGRKKLTVLMDQINGYFGDKAADLYKRAHIILNGATNFGNNAGFDRQAAFKPDTDINCEDTAPADEIAAKYSIKVTMTPYCGQIFDSYSPQALSAISNGFGSASAEIARRL